ncbi:MAG TPA: ankyrin repeat domain-containing protein [Actinomycetota bacterium]|nr:ankyrin repeat domain-containing protein [Actinomycetota bacterium]
MGQLIKAIQRGDAAAVARLLEADRTIVDERDEQGVSALLQAQYRGLSEIVDLLSKAKGWLDVFEAAAVGDAGRLELALAEDPEALKAFSPDGFTALHFAAFFGRRLPANLLLLAGADPNAEARNSTRVRPLHSAVAGPDPMMAETLLAMGADPNAVQQGGFTALHAAAKQGNASLAEILLGAGADPGLATNDGLLPADMARAAGHPELADRLASGSAGG